MSLKDYICTCLTFPRRNFCFPPVNFGLWGTIPAEIGFLTLLTVLNMMDHSRMWGEIPDLRRLSVLADLNLFGNNLGGTIPSTIGMHTSMTHLDLSYNWLVSTVPSSLGSLVLLEELYLEDNELVGSLPFAMIKLRGLCKYSTSAFEYRLSWRSRLSPYVPYPF